MSSVDEIFTADLTDVADHKLRGLMRAKDIWLLCNLADRKERLLMAHELHSYAMFSLNQLAKICRLQVPTVCRAMTKNAPGGRFQPEVLSSLIYLRKLVIVEGIIPASFVLGAVDTGTSVSTIARLTGASQSSLYLKTTTNK